MNPNFIMAGLLLTMLLLTTLKIQEDAEPPAQSDSNTAFILRCLSEGLSVVQLDETTFKCSPVQEEK